MKLHILLASLFVALAAFAEVPFQLFRQRVIALETEPTRLQEKTWMAEFETNFPPTVTEKRLTEINAALRPDGTFEGVVYQTDKPASMWPAMRHLHNCRELIIGYHAFPDQKQSLESCLKALDWWFTTKPKSRSGWDHFGYEGPILATVTALLPRETLTPERLALYTEKLKGLNPGMTGQNRLWVSWGAFLAGLVLEDAAKVEAALDSMGGVLAIAKPGQEGIQSDYSFHQHGPHFYQGNYGRHFLHSGSKFLRVVEGTRFATPEGKRIFEYMLLDATRLMCWGGLLDFNTIGRQITYYYRFQGADIRIACFNLLAANPERADEIKTYMEELARYPFSGPSSLPTGTFAFPKSDYILHRTRDWLFTLRLASRRVIATEGSNDNPQSDNFAQGQNYLYCDGTEYRGIFPVWNPACPPGSTFRNVEIPYSTKHRTTRGGDTFAVVSDEGVAAMRLKHAGVTGNKSWFFYDDRIVCLGSDIASDAPGSVVTTLEQMNAVSPPQETTGKTARAIRHRDTLWLFPKNAAYQFDTAEHSGNWRKFRDRNPDVEERRRVFFLALAHGEKPQGATYAYQTLPKGGDRLESPDAAWNEITVLLQTADCHAIRRGSEIRCVFFKPGTFTIGGKTVTAEKPGILVSQL